VPKELDAVLGWLEKWGVMCASRALLWNIRGGQIDDWQATRDIELDEGKHQWTAIV
jgi:hypothetical protein